MWEHNMLDELHRQLLDKGIIEIGGNISTDTAMYVREAFLRLVAKNCPSLTVVITSDGGSVDTGLDIYDALRIYPGEITGIVNGFARSMAAVILQACKVRKACRHSCLLIHHISRREISLDTLRDEEKLSRVREEMEKAQLRIYKILSDRTGKNVDEIKVECAKDEDMTAETALAFGLIDEII